ncbi:MAG: DUF6049 family protein [Pseudonocardia sp.]
MLAILLGVSGAASAADPAFDSATTGPAAQAPASGPRLDLRINEMTPRVVTADGPDTLTVSGELVNTGDEPVTDVKIRQQRGDRLRTEGELRTALAGGLSADAVLVGFTELAETLEPGQRMPVRLSVPLRGAGNDTLALQRTGVYPLLVNVNGTPEEGKRVRLGAVRVLLPVLGLPGTRPAGTTGGPAAADGTGAGGATGGGTGGGGTTGAGGGGPSAAVLPTVPADPADSNPVTVLYPLADQPRRLPTGPGEPVLLGSVNGADPLAEQLIPGGRLDGLLSALETAAPAGSAVRDAVCLAVDPDLVLTVRDAAGGYRLRGPDGTAVDGRGAELAGRWLARLRAAAAGRCVLALPFADADLVALSRAGLDDLVGYATRDGARIVADVLGTPVRADTTWPADGLLDERSVGDYLTAGGRTVVLSADSVARGGRSGRDDIGGVVRLTSPRGPAGPPIALLADPLLTLAAGAPGSTAAVAASADQVGTSGGRGLGSPSANASASPAGDGGPLSGQDLTGAVVFRALDQGSTGSTLLVAPPHQWNTTGADARELLGAVSTLIAAGRFRATPLAGGPGGGDPSRTAENASLIYPLRAGAREVPATVTAQLRAARGTAAELRSAAVAEPGVGSTPAQVFDPVIEGLLRASTAVFRGRTDDSTAAAKVITDRVRLLRSLVRVLEPPSPFALGDREAPLPITLSNGLPVAMNVRVALSSTPGLRTEEIPAQRIPPLGRLQLRVKAQLSRAGQFAVQARLTTLDGAALGPTSRLQLRSTAYGTITLWLTVAAGILLVVLAGRRIARRVAVARASGQRRPETANPSSPPNSPPNPNAPPAPDRGAAANPAHTNPGHAARASPSPPGTNPTGSRRLADASPTSPTAGSPGPPPVRGGSSPSMMPPATGPGRHPSRPRGR